MKNDDKIKYWFTTEKGVHVPVREGQSKEEALKERFSEPKFEKVGLLDGMGEHDERPEEGGRSRKGKEEQFFGESDFIEVDTDTFVNALAGAKATVDPKRAWRVSSPNSAEFDKEHPNAKKYITRGGSTVAIAQNGDIVALCRNENDSLHGWQLIKFAVRTAELSSILFRVIIKVTRGTVSSLFRGRISLMKKECAPMIGSPNTTKNP